MSYTADAPVRRPLAIRASKGAAALAAGLLLFGCEGDNLFEGGPTAGGTPEVVELIVPASIRSGDALDVRVRAQSLSNIDEVSIRLRRAVVEDTLIEVDPPRTQLTQDATFLVPLDVRDTIIVVQATVTNEAGGVSAVAEDTVRVTDVAAPTVTISLLPDEGGAGDSVAILVQSSDNVLLEEVGYLVLTEDADTVAFVSSPRGGVRQDSTVFFFEIPDTIPASELVVVGVGRDFQGLEGRSGPEQLTVLDRIVNEVEIISPRDGQRFPLDDSVQVEVRVVDRSGIRQIELLGFGLRGDPELGTEQLVDRFTTKTILFPAAGTDTFPTDTIVRRFLVAVPDTTREVVHLVARVTDVAGNVQADTANIVVGGPRVVVLNPTDGQQVQANRVLGIQVQAVDGQGLTRVRIIAEGAVNQTIVVNFSPARDTATVDTTLTIPASALGSFTLRAEAINTLNESGESDLLTLNVVQSGVSDTIPPTLSFELSSEQRLELTDSLSITIRAQDDPGGSGVARIGIAVIATNNDAVEALRPRLAESFSPPRTGTVVRTFGFTPSQFVDSLALPDTVVFQVFAFAVDEAGNCAAAIGATEQQLGCDDVTFPGDTIAASGAGARAEGVVVRGRTVRLPGGGMIADARLNVGLGKLYLSNFTFNTVEVLNLIGETFEQSVLVGSNPWGLFFDEGEDTLFVANSGGTNISRVAVTASSAVEVEADRIFTPNQVLWEVPRLVEFGFERLKAPVFIDFSDRPMFIAQDSRRRLLYSTMPTEAAPNGSIRMVDPDPVPGSTEDNAWTEFLVVGGGRAPIDVNAIDRYAIAGVDRIQVATQPNGDDGVILYSHVPGFASVSDSVIASSPVLPPCVAADSLNAEFIRRTGRARGPVTHCTIGRWIPQNVGLSDTTYVAASGNREHIAFGEGAVAPFGRIVIWDSEAADGQGLLSRDIDVADLVGNASETVNGIGLNQDGSLGVARGTNGAYFYTGTEQPAGPLRLQGIFSEGLAGGGAGATLHPLHDNARISDDRGVAFVGTTRRTIKSINTFHFFEVGEIHIRDNIVGPLRASLPLPGDPADVVLKLFGVTDAGGVVIINVRQPDLVR